MFEILQYDFMQRALLVGTVIAILCSVVGLFLVLRRYSLFGDALAHSSFGGVALGLFLGVYPMWTAYVVAIISALLISRVKDRFNISGDAAIAVLLSSGIAVGLVIIGISGGFTIDIFSFLFGSVLLVSVDDTILILAMTGSILIVILAMSRQILYSTFDEAQARVSGINVSRINYMMIFIAGITVVTAIQLVGVLLISALFVIPNVAAIMVGRGFKSTVIISIVMSVSCVLAGIMLSYIFNIAPAGSIVVLSILVLGGVMLAKSRGLVALIHQKFA